jgi:aspartate kinase
MKVMKFGGTSVGAPERMQSVARLVTADQEPKIVVLSALSGTTNALVRIGDLIASGQITEARSEIETLKAHYERFIGQLLSDPDIAGQTRREIAGHFRLLEEKPGLPFSEEQAKEILAQGELMSTRMFSHFLTEYGTPNVLLPALDFMFIDEYGEPDFGKIRAGLRAMLDRYTDTTLFVTQGYICTNHLGKTDNLKRGGSDYSASLIGAAAGSDIVQIWTDIDGMHNNDPRVVEKTFPIAELSFNEASELAYFGAKILHPYTIIPARDHNIPVQLKNTMAPEAPGTLIHAAEGGSQVKAIAAKDGIIAIKIKSTRMLLAYGFLRKVFEIFEKYRTPVDMITTSEVAVSLTIDNDHQLDAIVGELRAFGEVTVDLNQTIICIVGNRIVEKKGIVGNIFNALRSIPVRMISYGGSMYNISVLIESVYKKEAMVALNEWLFDIS